MKDVAKGGLMTALLAAVQAHSWVSNAEMVLKLLGSLMVVVVGGLTAYSLWLTIRWKRKAGGKPLPGLKRLREGMEEVGDE